MEEFDSYTLVLQNQTYKVRSSEDEMVVTAVFDRLQHEVEAAKTNQTFLSQHEELLIAALNMTQALLNLEEENKLFNTVNELEQYFVDTFGKNLEL